MHWSDLGLLENDEGGEEGGAAGAATRTNGGEGGGRYTVSCVTLFCRFSFVLSLSPVSSSKSLSLTLSLSFVLSFFLSLSLFGGQAGRGHGESPRAAGGLLDSAADGEHERTVYNIMIQ